MNSHSDMTSHWRPSLRVRAADDTAYPVRVETYTYGSHRFTHVFLLLCKIEPEASDYGVQIFDVVQVPFAIYERAVQVDGEGKNGDSSSCIDDGELMIVGASPSQVDNGV